MSHLIFNGKKVLSQTPCISAYDRGLTLGHGLFETMLFNKKSVPLLEYHWQRLVTSANLLDIKLPFNCLQLGEMICDLISENQLERKNAAVRLTVTDGVFERGLLSDGAIPNFVLSISELPKSQKASMSAAIVNIRRNEHSTASRVKNISYLDNILAKKEAVSRGYDEALLLNSQSMLAEGAISNLFVVKGGAVYTPFVEDGALPGIIRHLLLYELRSEGIETSEKQLDIDTLLSADEVFISNALIGIKPIHQINDHVFNAPGKVTQALSNCLRNKFSYV